jgi:hypothetical protein
MNQDTEARVRLMGECHRLEGQRDRLASLCRRLIDQAWGDFPEDCRESVRRDHPSHSLVRAEAELREIEGGPS